MRIRAQLAWVSILVAGFVSALPAQQAPKPSPAAAGNPPPVQASGSPAAPPEVIYHDGLLSIRAENSTLGDVLRAVQRATGASIESPGLSSERVYAKLGPGQPRDVLASLLDGSHYNYILIGSRQQPNSVARVMLTVRQAGQDQPAPPAAAARATPPPPPVNEDVDTSSNTPDRTPPTPPVPPNQMAGQNAQENQQQPGQIPNGLRTPEQMLQQLQQMRQQQQQQFQLQQQLQQQWNQPR